ncbi:cellulose binding domain-containing protein, partial [Streptomyces galbus]
MSTHRRRISGRNKVIGGALAAAVIGGGVVLLTSTAQAAGIGAAYTRTSDWSTGYTAQYVVTNNSGQQKADWTLEFDLPSGARLSSLWNAESSVSGQRVTVRPPKWDGDGLKAGESVTVGFVVNGTVDPTGCRIDGASCSTDSAPTPAPTAPPPAPTARGARGAPIGAGGAPAGDDRGALAAPGREMALVLGGRGRTGGGGARAARCRREHPVLRGSPSQAAAADDVRVGVPDGLARTVFN